MVTTVIGAGAWGTALAVAAAPWNSVVLVPRQAAAAQDLEQSRENRRYLPGVRFPSALRVTHGLSDVLTYTELLVVAVPVAGLRDVCIRLRDWAAVDTSHTVPPLVWLCKGLEEGTAKLPHEIVTAELPGVVAAVLSGPSFADEVALGLPTALTVASHSEDLAKRVVNTFHHGSMRVYRSQDVIGVEVGGAVKNILAIATGIADGLALGFNARAALMTRGLSEMMRLGQSLGGHPETLMGLTGVGDLILTCTGNLSRNRKVGIALAAGQPLAQVLDELGHVAEGVRCARAVRDLARSRGVEMPIIEAVCDVMFGELRPRDAVAALFARAPRSEN